VGPGKEIHSEDFAQRIGTAFRQEEGSLMIQLAATPINGPLLIRPPRHGEHQDPTCKEQ
jgi:hypothetical protein